MVIQHATLLSVCGIGALGVAGACCSSKKFNGVNANNTIM